MAKNVLIRKWLKVRHKYKNHTVMAENISIKKKGTPMASLSFFVIYLVHHWQSH